MHTTNGGGDWTEQTSGTLNDIAFADANHGLAIGAAGLVLKTTNAGATWMTLPASTTEDLLAVAYPATDAATVVGNRGTILRTSDGGSTWTPQASGTTNSVAAVSFVDPEHGWAVGHLGSGKYFIIHTSDGGGSWGVQMTNIAHTLRAVHFTDRQNGTVVGNDGLILHTTNGGADWQTQLGRTSAALSGVFFTDAETGWIVGSGILHTRVAGAVQTRNEPAGDERPLVAGLEPNAPSPFIEETAIGFTLNAPGPVRLLVYDLLGRRVAVLVNAAMDSGHHSVRWNPGDLPSGVYWCRLEAEGRQQTRPLVRAQ